MSSWPRHDSVMQCVGPDPRTMTNGDGEPRAPGDRRNITVRLGPRTSRTVSARRRGRGRRRVAG
eukprot:753261-Hanusia_phi.AAC.5